MAENQPLLPKKKTSEPTTPKNTSAKETSSQRNKRRKEKHDDLTWSNRNIPKKKSSKELLLLSKRKARKNGSQDDIASSKPTTPKNGSSEDIKSSKRTTQKDGSHDETTSSRPNTPKKTSTEELNQNGSDSGDHVHSSMRNVYQAMQEISNKKKGTSTSTGTKTKSGSNESRGSCEGKGSASGYNSSRRRRKTVSFKPGRISDELNYHYAADFFTTIGDWNVFYFKIIVLDSLMRAFPLLNEKVFRKWAGEAKNNLFVDCNGSMYYPIPNQELFQTAQSDMEVNAGLWLSSVGDMIGYIACAFFATKLSPRIGTIFGALTFVASGALIFGQKSGVPMKFGWVFIRMGAQMCQVLSFEHCAESVPVHIRPLALALLFLNEFAMDAIMETTITRSINTWSLELFFVVIFLIFLIFYFFFCPSSVMFLLSEGDATGLKEIISNNNDQVMDVDDTMEQVLFLDVDASTSKLRMLWDSLKSRHFRNKIALLLLVQLIECSSTTTVSASLVIFSNIGTSERNLIKLVLSAMGVAISFAVITLFGRRCSLATFCLLLLVAHAITYTAKYTEQWDICSTRYDVSRGFSLKMWTLGVLMFILMCAHARHTLALMILEHLPSVNRGLIYPFFLAVNDFISHMQTSAMSAIESKTQKSLTSNLEWGFVTLFIVIPAVFFIDDSDIMPTTASDIPCYGIKSHGYTKEPEMNDVPDEMKHNLAHETS